MKKDPASLMLSTVTKKLHELGYVLKVPGLYNGSSLKSFDDSEPYITNNKLTNGARVPENNLLRSFCADKEKATNVAKIKVVVCPYAFVSIFPSISIVTGIHLMQKEVLLT
ncbi:hypothetical protein LOK49_LG05G00004 [Camellia lanceoleosa]|uniref:Uncharacterized protein n=1 Tax=Camellia lanceoleosa TaxID=1840588 RepID=A0ACC0HKC9_9ERIC|nr:hypothetical protein LOK49_LG05G00004 [Camellia lanceoleosa]